MRQRLESAARKLRTKPATRRSQTATANPGRRSKRRAQLQLQTQHTHSANPSGKRHTIAENDPMDAAIERHKHAARAQEKAVHEFGKIEARYMKAKVDGYQKLADYRAADRQVMRAINRLDAAAIALAKTVPTTMLGALACLTYLHNLPEPEMFWPDHPDFHGSYAAVMHGSLAKGMAKWEKAARRRLH